MRHLFRTRLRLLFIAVGIFALLLLVRLYFVQVVHGEAYALAAEHQYVNDSDTLYDRGTIYFTRKDGTLISAATLATGFLLAINPEQITDPAAAYTALNAIYPLDRDDFMAHATKPDDPYEVVADRVPEAAGSAIADADIPGVLVIRERWRLYPAGAEAAQTLGLVGEDAGDSTLRGHYGLEREYDSVLERSGDGLFGNFFAELFANIGNAVSDPRAASEGDVVTSIEPVVEEKLDQELASVQAEYSSQETGGIIMNPSTGEIYALDVVPSFDPNNPGSDIALFSNHLVERRYEFGSIVKTLTMTSGIDSGVITANTTYDDTGCIEVDKSRICNYDLRARGVIPMQQILSQSLNVGASWVATQMGHATMQSYFAKLGMGEKTGVDLPSEIGGTIANLTSPGEDVNYDTASFGQGIAETPVEMIRALGALANYGSIVSPHIATAIRLESGITKPLTYPPPVQVFKPSSAATVTNMLITVVDTALLNGQAKNPVMSVAAKTGTAQIADPAGGYYPDGIFFHSFMGYFPATDPKFIILLYTVRPQGVEYASETLTASFLDLVHFLTNYYSVPPDRAQYTDTTSQ